MCVLMPWWKQFMTNGVCLIVYRHPEAVAKSLAKWNSEYTLHHQHSMALWERHIVDSLNACIDLPTILVSHDDLSKRPYDTVASIVQHLQHIGSSGGVASTPLVRKYIDNLHAATSDDVATFYNPSLLHFRHTPAPKEDDGVPHDLYQYLEHLHSSDGELRTRLSLSPNINSCSSGVANHYACTIPSPLPPLSTQSS
jgi:hypothetical protein